MTCLDADCSGQIIWNDGSMVNLDALNVRTTVDVSDPPNTLECTSGFIYDGARLINDPKTTGSNSIICQYSECNEST